METELRLNVSLPAGTSYIDVAGLLSAANHRLYRQHKTYTVKCSVDGETAAALGGDEQFIIDVLPMTWPVLGSIREGRRKFIEAMSPEMMDTKPARWSDFRMKFDVQQSLTNTIYIPSGVSMPAISHQYAFSTVADDSGNLYTYHVLGASDLSGAERSFGCLDNYDRKDDTDVDNQPTQAQDWHLVDNDRDEVNEQLLNVQGSYPPYNKDNLQAPQKRFQIFAFGSNVNNVGYSMKSTGFIDVPLGLMKVVNNVSAARSMTITVKAGDHKGAAGVNV
jgi:hypothetical protein